MTHEPSATPANEVGMPSEVLREIIDKETRQLMAELKNKGFNIDSEYLRRDNMRLFERLLSEYVAPSSYHPFRHHQKAIREFCKESTPQSGPKHFFEQFKFKLEAISRNSKINPNGTLALICKFMDQLSGNRYFSDALGLTYNRAAHLYKLLKIPKEPDAVSSDDEGELLKDENNLGVFIDDDGIETNSDDAVKDANINDITKKFDIEASKILKAYMGNPKFKHSPLLRKICNNSDKSESFSAEDALNFVARCINENQKTISRRSKLPLMFDVLTDLVLKKREYIGEQKNTMVMLSQSRESFFQDSVKKEAAPILNDDNRLKSGG